MDLSIISVQNKNMYTVYNIYIYDILACVFFCKKKLDPFFETTAEGHICISYLSEIT